MVTLRSFHNENSCMSTLKVFELWHMWRAGMMYSKLRGVFDFSRLRGQAFWIAFDEMSSSDICWKGLALFSYIKMYKEVFYKATKLEFLGKCRFCRTEHLRITFELSRFVNVAVPAITVDVRC